MTEAFPLHWPEAPAAGITCWKCGFVLDTSNPLNCSLPNCKDEACPLDHVGGYPQGRPTSADENELPT